LPEHVPSFEDLDDGGQGQRGGGDAHIVQLRGLEIEAAVSEHDDAGILDQGGNAVHRHRGREDKLFSGWKRERDRKKMGK
jgi:hypothetical protein